VIKPDCWRAGRLISGREAGLSAAAALTLEEHLATCARCSADARQLDGLRELSDLGASPLKRAVRERAILRALATTVSAPEAASPAVAVPAWLRPSAYGALAAIALVVASVWLRAGTDPRASVGSSGRLVSGQLDFEGEAVRSGQRLELSGLLQTRSGAVVELAHARVQLRAGTRARWDGRTHAVSLREGSLVADVDPARKAPFSVETASFRAIVLGTRFEVAPTQVKVWHGQVRVVALDGRELARLSAGQSHSVSPPSRSTPAAAGTAAAEPAPMAAQENELTGSAARPSRTSARAGARVERAPEPARARATTPPVVATDRVGQPTPAEAPTENVADLLDRARVELAGRRVKGARGLIDRALAASFEPSVRAEALTLRAECALVSGDAAAAVRGYLEVAERYASLPAGESALFAAARTEVDRKAFERARPALERYLARYPNGRFTKEARARLRELTAP
jgi:ferric-dicitrate binding protein FerR (iron transport regulator)